MSQKTLTTLFVVLFILLGTYLGFQLLTSSGEELKAHNESKEEITRSILDINSP